MDKFVAKSAIVPWAMSLTVAASKRGTSFTVIDRGEETGLTLSQDDTRALCKHLIDAGYGPVQDVALRADAPLPNAPSTPYQTVLDARFALDRAAGAHYRLDQQAVMMGDIHTILAKREAEVSGILDVLGEHETALHRIETRLNSAASELRG